MPNTVLEENMAGCKFVDVRPCEVLDRSLSGLELSFHLKAVKTIRVYFKTTYAAHN